MALVSGTGAGFDGALVAVVVLAAGSGSRYGRRKQFDELSPGRRLVDVALETALAVSNRVVLALPRDVTWNGVKVEAVVSGGSTRVQSTRAVLSTLDPMPQVVIIHDAAHPLVTPDLMIALANRVREGADAAVPVVPLADVVKRVGDNGELRTVGRDGLVLAQAPMAFAAAILQKALTTQSGNFWEDSMLVEGVGGRVVAHPGSRWNIHVVNPDDLEVVRALAALQRSKACG